MDNAVKKLAQMIKESENIVFFGGAGVSTESGVPDYRSENGIYNTVSEFGVSPELILSHDFFFEHTSVFYDFYRKYFITDAPPNRAHIALARLEKMGKISAVITQNIDKLHHKAGSNNVIELHGNGNLFRCTDCNETETGDTVNKEILGGNIPVCKKCGAVLKPAVVLYGEQLDEDDIERAICRVENADMLIIGGTSLAVYPAASFVEYFKGRHIVIINKQETSYDKKADLVINDSIGDVFEKVMKLL